MEAIAKVGGQEDPSTRSTLTADSGSQHCPCARVFRHAAGHCAELGGRSSFSVKRSLHGVRMVAASLFQGLPGFSVPFVEMRTRAAPATFLMIYMICDLEWHSGTTSCLARLCSGWVCSKWLLGNERHHVTPYSIIQALALAHSCEDV